MPAYTQIFQRKKKTQTDYWKKKKKKKTLGIVAIVPDE